jgi:hypothetical protein
MAELGFTSYGLEKVEFLMQKLTSNFARKALISVKITKFVNSKCR